MTTFASSAMICPKCRLLFKSIVIASYGYLEKDTDFYPNYWGFNPLPHFVHRCPGCGFVAYEDEFEEPTQQVLLEELPEDPNDSGVTRYSDAAAYYAEKGEDKLVIATCYLKAGWCARIEGKRKEERIMLAKAAQWFTEALDEGTVEEEERAVIAYLIGELHRRCRRFEEALKFFERAKREPVTPRWLLSVVERQAELARARDSSNTQFEIKDDLDEMENNLE
ncbi:MAG: DUF2225 domain-containing protein [Armatimonadota bacterium]|nr:DUF2225 domain-containing protein [Armatimonadota bacterium]MDW8144168.1 DUF2225 domain-containing protein [Armatimonadota bacterium]